MITPKQFYPHHTWFLQVALSVSPMKCTSYKVKKLMGLITSHTNYCIHYSDNIICIYIL